MRQIAVIALACATTVFVCVPPVVDAWSAPTAGNLAWAVLHLVCVPAAMVWLVRASCGHYHVFHVDEHPLPPADPGKHLEMSGSHHRTSNRAR